MSDLVSAVRRYLDMSDCRMKLVQGQYYEGEMACSACGAEMTEQGKFDQHRDGCAWHVAFGALLVALKCCERDHDGDGNCDRHPAENISLEQARRRVVSVFGELRDQFSAQSVAAVRQAAKGLGQPDALHHIGRGKAWQEAGAALELTLAAWTPRKSAPDLRPHPVVAPECDGDGQCPECGFGFCKKHDYPCQCK